jgi:ABC-type Fe3+ transport system substrate-binding protein
LVIKFSAEINSRRGVSDYVNLPSNVLTSTAFIKQGAIAKFVVSQDAAFPPGSKNPGYWYAWRSEKASTVYRIGALTDEEVKLIRTYQGLADPRFKGRLGITSVNNSTCAATVYLLMYGPKPQLWTGLARNKPKVKPSSQALVSSILAGEVDIGVLSGSSSPLIAAKDGAPIAFGSSAPSATLYTPGAISALAPHPNAARLWQDWFTSVEGQRLWVSLTGNQSVRNGINQAGWAEKQAWYFDDHASLHQFDWNAFSSKQKVVIARFASDIQGS